MIAPDHSRPTTRHVNFASLSFRVHSDAQAGIEPEAPLGGEPSDRRADGVSEGIHLFKVGSGVLGRTVGSDWGRG